ncbi:hypothetical protein N0V90_004820 [Kalmusia sp. IMI 367209]|nr:hypothetical protein N0V90_004820 [Kalmusia sp. IMI 367209]
MPCGLQLHLHYKLPDSWYRKCSDMQVQTCGNGLSVPINPATAFPQQHVRCQKLGSGSEATVEAWRHTPSSSVIAVKVYKRPQKEFPPEVRILKSLPCHASIITCIAYLPKQSLLGGDCVFFELCPAGDLFDLRKNLWKTNKSIFSEAVMWSIYNQLSAALAFLHEGIGCPGPTDADIWQPVVHRDIKLENIFIMTLGHKFDYSDIEIKLGDFGLSAFYDPSNAQLPGWWGTTVMWPPEQTWEGGEATPAGDIWAIGCIIHELAHGFPPVVDPDITEKKMREEDPQFVARWGSRLRESFLAAKSPRKPLPINLKSDQHAIDARRKRPTPKYSNVLNKCMMSTLNMSMKDRVTAGDLKAKIEEEYATYMFEELKSETEALQQERNECFRDELDEYI